MPLVSVIVPVLDDVCSLERALKSLGDDSRVEIIVVNAGERTLAIIALEHAKPQVRWLRSLPGRGRQMNVGARLARGDWLLFFDADTRLPAGWIVELERAGQDSSLVGGSFRFHPDSARRWALERGVAARVRWLNVRYGDQALFVHREVCAVLGGYYFIGLRRPHPELFQGVPWSTADVLAATLAIAAREGPSLTLIPSWYDVDTAPDLERALGTGASFGARPLQAWATRRRRSSPAATRVTRRGHPKGEA